MIGNTDTTSTHDHGRLGRFIAELLLDFKKLEAYKIDSATATANAGLSDREKLLLAEGTFQQICNHVYTTGPGPAPDLETDD